MSFIFSVHFNYLTVWKQRRQLKRLDNNNVGEFSLIKYDVEAGNNHHNSNNNRNINNNIVISKSYNNNNRSKKCYRSFILRCYNCYSTCCKLKKTLLPFFFAATIYIFMYSISVENINEKILNKEITSNDTTTIFNSSKSNFCLLLQFYSLLIS